MLQVGQQVVGRVRREVRLRVARVRLAPTAAALVEEDGPVGAGIEVAAEACGAPRSGTAVQDDRGLTVGTTAGSPSTRGSRRRRRACRARTAPSAGKAPSCTNALRRTGKPITLSPRPAACPVNCPSRHNGGSYTKSRPGIGRGGREDRMDRYGRDLERHTLAIGCPGPRLEYPCTSKDP